MLIELKEIMWEDYSIVKFILYSISINQSNALYIHEELHRYYFSTCTLRGTSILSLQKEEGKEN